MYFDKILQDRVNNFSIVYLVDELGGNQYALSRSASLMMEGSDVFGWSVGVNDSPNTYVCRNKFSSEHEAKVLFDNIKKLMFIAEQANFRAT